jgi:hypothetical protein
LIITEGEIVFGQTSLEGSGEVTDALDERTPRHCFGGVEPTCLCHAPRIVEPNNYCDRNEVRKGVRIEVRTNARNEVCGAF